MHNPLNSLKPRKTSDKIALYQRLRILENVDAAQPIEQGAAQPKLLANVNVKSYRYGIYTVSIPYTK